MARNGKPIKARRIGGVKVVPKWNWTREYASDVRWHDRELTKGPVGEFTERDWYRFLPTYSQRRERYIGGVYQNWLDSRA